MEPLGLYLHIPFCRSKCAYCDFYSFPGDAALLDRYTDALCGHIATAAETLALPADTLYLGGGTPSLLGGERIAKLVGQAVGSFHMDETCEITLEANPADDLRDTLKLAAKAGVNRLSLGVQSGVEAELRALSRRHTVSDVRRTVADALTAGIENISLDLMLGIPGQTEDSLRRSIEFLTDLRPSHISAYLLKIEPGTPFGRKTPAGLPDEERAADLYLQAVAELFERGFAQYEISNFAKDGRVSRHNLKYWTGAPYLGLGPAAHSMLRGKRFCFPPDVERYLAGAEPIPDGDGGGRDEYVMLRLRLREGIDLAEYGRRFGAIPNSAMKRMEQYAGAGYAVYANGRFALTPEGFLLSNTIIADLLERLG